MNSAPNRMKSAATETSDEIRNSAECTALRAMTVSSPATIAAIEKIQKKTVSQPDRIIMMNDERGVMNALFAFWQFALMIQKWQLVHWPPGKASPAFSSF